MLESSNCSFDFNEYRQKFFQGLQKNKMSNKLTHSNKILTLFSIHSRSLINPFFPFRNIGFGFPEYMERSTKCFDVKD